jgi:hypothetical protein
MNGSGLKDMSEEELLNYAMLLSLEEEEEGNRRRKERERMQEEYGIGFEFDEYMDDDDGGGNGGGGGGGVLPNSISRPLNLSTPPQRSSSSSLAVSAGTPPPAPSSLNTSVYGYRLGSANSLLSSTPSGSRNNQNRQWFDDEWDAFDDGDHDHDDENFDNVEGEDHILLHDGEASADMWDSSVGPVSQYVSGSPTTWRSTGYLVNFGDLELLNGDGGSSSSSSRTGGGGGGGGVRSSSVTQASLTSSVTSSSLPIPTSTISSSNAGPSHPNTNRRPSSGKSSSSWSSAHNLNLGTSNNRNSNNKQSSSSYDDDDDDDDDDFLSGEVLSSSVGSHSGRRNSNNQHQRIVFGSGAGGSGSVSGSSYTGSIGQFSNSMLRSPRLGPTYSHIASSGGAGRSNASHPNAGVSVAKRPSREEEDEELMYVLELSLLDQ